MNSSSRVRVNNIQLMCNDSLYMFNICCCVWQSLVSMVRPGGCLFVLASCHGPCMLMYQKF